MATVVPQVHLIHRHPLLSLPPEDLEQPLLLGHPDSGPKSVTPDVRICLFLPQWSDSRYAIVL